MFTSRTALLLYTSHTAQELQDCSVNNSPPPAAAQVWRSILSEEPRFSRGSWQDISDQAKDFCKSLLNK
jgi:hypothetical protein